MLVGRRGVYAINVVARRAAKEGRARLAGGTLEFSDGDNSRKVSDWLMANRQLEKQLARETGRMIKVRSVIAVPGWEIEQQDDLLVNERTLPMIRGWANPAEFLMDEDIEIIQAHLSERCKRVRR